MKTNKIIYWISTVIVAGMMAMAGVTYFTNPMVVEGFKHLGFPDYFRMELGAGKLLGAVILILPMIPARVKEWAYAAFGIVFISAFIAHTTVDGIAKAVMPVVLFAILIVSYVDWNKLQKAKPVKG